MEVFLDSLSSESIGFRCLAVASLGILPMLVAYPFFQKYFVQGITIGAVRG